MTFDWKTHMATRLVSWGRHLPETVGEGFVLPFSSIEPILACNRLGEVFSAGSSDEMMEQITAKLNIHIKLPCSLKVFPLMVGDNLLGGIALLSDKENIEERIRNIGDCENKTYMVKYLSVMRQNINRLLRLIGNLLSNAIKHTPQGGHIRVSLHGTATTVTLSVEDDGEGIPDDKKDIIFDRFKQVDTSLTRASEGSGSTFYLEMPVVKRKMETTTNFLDGMDISRKVKMEFSDIQ